MRAATMPRMKERVAATLASLALVATACTSNDSNDSKGGSSSTSASTSTTTTPVPATLTVLVTNDDGYAADGIDLIVRELLKLPATSLTVVAPAKDQSGTGGTTTPGTLTATKQTTKSGYPATAVDGYPADSVKYALSTVLTEPPDLVVAGVNNGQNIGPFVAVSGTVGAAKAAAAKGIPAIAVSQGLGSPTDYAAAARIAISYITTHRGEFDGSQDGTARVVNINAPTCTTGTVRAVQQVPVAAGLSGRDVTKVDCSSAAAESPRDDVEAFVEGFATLTVLDASGTTVTATTAWTG
jgi:5'-nucleotidase